MESIAHRKLGHLRKFSDTHDTRRGRTGPLKTNPKCYSNLYQYRYQYRILTYQLGLKYMSYLDRRDEYCLFKQRGTGGAGPVEKKHLTLACDILN